MGLISLSVMYRLFLMFLFRPIPALMYPFQSIPDDSSLFISPFDPVQSVYYISISVSLSFVKINPLAVHFG